MFAAGFLLLVSSFAINAQDVSWDESLADNEVDPWESFNRKVYNFNDWFDGKLFKPVAKAYDAVTPTFIQVGVGNFFSNLGELPTLGNDILQGKFQRAASATGRFIVNTTIGIGGTIDVASKMGLEHHDEDFGQTLAVWGVDAGPYVVLPFLGSSTLRDSSAFIVDWNTDPLSYVDDQNTEYGLRALDLLDTRAELLKAEELIIGDRYVFIRDAYLQSREYDIADGNVEQQEQADFDDFGGFDDF